ncbi:MAG: VOC family protein [Rhodothalassiaceae bacterium]
MAPTSTPTTTGVSAKPDAALWLTSYIVVADMARTIRFLTEGLGFTLGDTMAGPDGPIHAEFHYKDVIVLMAAPEGTDGNPLKAPKTMGVPMPFNFYLYCDDVDAAYDRALAAGALSEEAPTDQFWGDRTARVTDPDGYSWMLATKVGDFDPAKAPPAA